MTDTDQPATPTDSGSVSADLDVWRTASASAPAAFTFQQLQNELAKERGPKSWIHSLPTTLRRVLALLAAAATFVLLAAIAPRPDLHQLPELPLLLQWATGAVLLALLGRHAVAAVQAPTPRPAQLALLLLLAFVFVLAIDFYPTIAGPSSRALDGTFSCLALGTAISVAIAVVLWALSRATTHAQAYASAAAAGVVANLALGLHCPSTSAAHLIVGHAAVLLAALVAAHVWEHRRAW